MLRTLTLGLGIVTLLAACPRPIDIDHPVVDEPEPPACEDGSCEPEPGPCLFGDVFRDLRESEAFASMPDEWITAEEQLASEVERAQLVRAVQQSSHDDVSTVEEALSRVDEAEVRRIWFTHRASGRAYVVYEYGAGDNSYGAYFEQGKVEVLAQIHDGDVLECRVLAE